MQELGKMEDQIFKDRQSKELSFKARNKEKRRREKLFKQDHAPKWVPEGQFAPMVCSVFKGVFLNLSVLRRKKNINL